MEHTALILRHHIAHDTAAHLSEDSSNPNSCTELQVAGKPLSFPCGQFSSDWMPNAVYSLLVLEAYSTPTELSHFANSQWLGFIFVIHAGFFDYEPTFEKV